jgi:hypothetical protein
MAVFSTLISWRQAWEAGSAAVATARVAAYLPTVRRDGQIMVQGAAHPVRTGCIGPHHRGRCKATVTAHPHHAGAQASFIPDNERQRRRSPSGHKRQ